MEGRAALPLPPGMVPSSSREDMSSLDDLDGPKSNKEPPVLEDADMAAKTPKVGERDEVEGSKTGATGGTLHAWASPNQDEELEKELGLAPSAVSHHF